jgi:hypothetical protein
MNINDMFPSNWLKAGDIPEDENLVLTIKSVEIEEVGQGDDKEQKPVCYFEETEKGLVLNKTNATAVAEQHGPDTREWTGKRIALFATEVDFKGKSTLAIRVRLRAPKKQLTAAGAGKGPDWETD